MNSAAQSSARDITRASRSNLALSFIALPRERREDITVFYAWCRTIDDIVDEKGRAPDERRAALDLWQRALVVRTAREPTLAEAVRALIAKYNLPLEHFGEILAGVEMDIEHRQYETWEDLRVYCHRVASVVGLVSIEIFGAKDPACRQYALDLGLALQLTNILRDVAEDYANDGRVYLPRAEMDSWGYSIGDLAERRHNTAFRGLMEFEAERAASFYAAAESELPPAETRAMLPAEIMRIVYLRLLQKMRRGGFRVFDRRYSLGRLKKAAIVARQLLRAKFARDLQEPASSPLVPPE